MYSCFPISAHILHIILIFFPISLSRPQLYHHRKTRSQVIPLYPCMPWSSVDTEYSIHRAQHTPSTASTQDWLSSLQSHDYGLTSECSFSFPQSSLHNRLLSASSPWQLDGEVTLSHSHGCKLINWWIESQHAARRPSTASKYSANLDPSRPASVSEDSLDHGLQVHLHARSITASDCILRDARLWPSRSHDHGIQVHLQTRSIMMSECIFKFTRSRHPSASLNSHDHGLQVHL